MKIFQSIITVLFISILMQNCGPAGKNTNGNDNQENATQQTEEKPLLLTPVKSSPTFEDAILALNSPEEDAELSAGEVPFSYNVTNYQLAAQTEDAEIKMCANSSQGQHIHLILNNEPYTAHYEAEFKKELERGHYVALSFLSRSYHESIKQPQAFVLRQFTVGDAQPENIDLTSPHMFYSRPKGTYEGADTKKIMLDFYLVNADLSQEGYKVRATINGQEFLLTEWVPYFVEGLPLGENTFKLELLDENDQLVDSPFNPVERTIILKEEIPL